MNLLRGNPRSPFLFAYLALLPGCVFGALGLLAYALMSGPGVIDLGKVLAASALVFIIFGFALAVGALLVTFYMLPVIWLLLRLRMAGPVLMLFFSVLPGAGLWLLGAADYRKFAGCLLGFGAGVGLSFCALAYRRMSGDKD